MNLMKQTAFATIITVVILLCFLSCDKKKESDRDNDAYVAENSQQTSDFGNEEQTEYNKAGNTLQIVDDKFNEQVQTVGEDIVTSGNGYSTEAEDFSIMDFFEDETDTRYLEKMPEHKRPDGYEEPLLGCKTALEILAETRKSLMYLDYSGAPYFAMDEWAGDKNNYIKICYEDGYVEFEHFFVPPLDTLAEIEEYFLPILGEAYISNLKEFGLEQQSDGRVTHYNAMGYIGYTLSEYWDKAEILSISQKNGSKEAVATFKLTNIPNNEYDGEFEYSFEKEVEFILTDDYGWQLAFDQETYTWL